MGESCYLVLINGTSYDLQKDIVQFDPNVLVGISTSHQGRLVYFHQNKMYSIYSLISRHGLEG